MKTGTEAQTRGEGRAPCERRWEKRGKMGDEGGGNSATDLKQQRGADTECVRAMWVGVRDGDPETGRGAGRGDIQREAERNWESQIQPGGSGERGGNGRFGTGTEEGRREPSGRGREMKGFREGERRGHTGTSSH